LGKLRDFGFQAATDFRMRDAFEHGKLRRAVGGWRENDPREGFAIDFAIGADDIFTPAAADGRADGGDAEDFVASAVGIELCGTKLAEDFGDGAFAAGDAAEEAEDFHAIGDEFIATVIVS
jgi:hypothetical protein